MVVKTIELLFPAFVLYFLNNLIEWLDLFEVLLGANQDEFFLSSGDRDIEALQIFQQDTFLGSLLGA